ncbi:MAG: peptidoglycan editing factor PgeF [Aquabacterium sp.]
MREDPPWALRPGWRVAPGVRAVMSMRPGGHSPAPWASFNLGSAVGDDPVRVAAHRQALGRLLGATPVWLRQVHGAQVVRLEHSAQAGLDITADAAWSDQPGMACVVQAADCLPVLLCTPQGHVVGAAHAGWRGLAAGVLEALLQPMCEAAACAPAEVSAWLGPCIGPQCFEVGADVLLAFGSEPVRRTLDPAFRYQPRPDGDARWMADLVMLARRRLARAGVRRISGGRWCTVNDETRFFSYRRESRGGRMAAGIAAAPR